MSTQISTNELIEKMAKEIGRLQKLCKNNGINYLPPAGPSATMGVSVKLEISNPKKESN